MIYIGVDIGTSSVKIIAMTKDGNILKEVTRTYPLSLPKENWAEQNPEDWLKETILGIKSITNSVDKELIKGISFSGQMHGLVALDNKDAIIRPAILWCDGRSHEEVLDIKRDIGWDKLSSWTGNIAFAGFTAPKILWMKKNEPELYKQISKIMLPKDYLVYKLTGIFASDYSDSSGTLYLDVENKIWSKPMLEYLGIDETYLPKLMESYNLVGKILPEMANTLNVPPDTEIIMGGGDQACAAIGGGVVKQSIGSISIGTSGVIFAKSKKFAMDKTYGLHGFCHADGQYHMMGCMLSAAGAFKWWVEDIHGKNLSNKEINILYDVILKEASQASINNGLYFLPYLMGERSPHNDSYCRGSFIGLNMSHTRGDMTRSILEGVAFGLKDSLVLMESQGIKLSYGVINGGGARSNLWCKIIADVLDLELIKLKTDAGPAYGAAILAAVGCGAYESVEKACEETIKVKERILTNTELVRSYKKKYDVYKTLYPVLKESFPTLNY